MDEFVKKEKEILLGNFFHVESTWKQIASQFNDLSAVPYLKEEALQKILNTGLFDLEGRIEYSLVGKSTETTVPNATWKLDIRSGDGVTLTESPSSGSPIKSELNNVTAETEGDALVLNIETTGGNLKLKSKELPKVFDGAERLKKIIRELPKTAREVVDLNTSLPQNAAILVALKFGKGGYDRTAGEYVYTIDDINHIMYMFKNNNVIHAGDDTYLEQLDVSVGGDEFQGIKLTKWYQRFDKETKIKSLFIDYESGGCSRECYSTKYPENQCFRTGDTLEVRFAPANLDYAADNSLGNADLPDIKLASKGISTEYCLSPFLKN